MNELRISEYLLIYEVFSLDKCILSWSGPRGSTKEFTYLFSESGAIVILGDCLLSVVGNPDWRNEESKINASDFLVLSVFIGGTKMTETNDNNRNPTPLPTWAQAQSILDKSK